MEESEGQETQESESQGLGVVGRANIKRTPGSQEDELIMQPSKLFPILNNQEFNPDILNP